MTNGFDVSPRVKMEKHLFKSASQHSSLQSKITCYDVVKTNGINLAHRSSSKVSVDMLLGKERGVVNQLICKFLT